MYINNTIYNVLTENLSVKNIIDIIKIKKKLSINLVDSKIMNQMSYFVSTNKIKSLGFKSSKKIKKSIHDTLKLFNLINIKN